MKKFILSLIIGLLFYSIASGAVILPLPPEPFTCPRSLTCIGKLGAAITTIAGTDTLSASRSVINTNFSNLNAALFDWTATGANGAATTSTLYLQGQFGAIQASSTNNFLASTTILGSLNVGTLTATSGTTYLNALSLGTALSDANIASATTWNGKASYSFTPTQNLGVTMSATTSNIELLGAGIYASSTSILSTTTVQGSLNVGTLTATSGTSYLNALSLGTGLSNANLANSSITITPAGIVSASGCNPVSLGGTCTLTVNPNLIQTSVSNTKYLTASTTNLAWLFQTGFISQASSTLSSGFTSTASSTFGNDVSFSGSASTSKLDVRGSFATTIGSTTGATAYTLDWSTGSYQRIIMGGNIFVAINATSSNPQDGGHYILKLCQDSTGSRTVTFSTPAQLRWWNGTTTITSTANYCSMIGMLYDLRSARYDIVASSTGLLAQ